MKKNILITEMKLINLVKQIINEDNLMSSFLSSNKFENCRGVRLRLGGGGGSASSPAEARAQRIARREINKENKKNWKIFKQDKPEVSLEYYLDLKNELERFNGINIPYYRPIFDSEGKPFTKQMTQFNVNLIEILMKDNSFFLFYYRDIFGNKTPNLVDLYNYYKELGGEKALEEINEKNYNYQKYRDILTSNVELYNNELKKQFPFVEPSSPTKYMIVWFNNDPNKPDRSSDGVAKMRYFNNYEEAVLASQIAEAEGNKVSSSETNPAGGFVTTSFKYKPKGTATDLLFKKQK